MVKLQSRLKSNYETTGICSHTRPVSHSEEIPVPILAGLKDENEMENEMGDASRTSQPFSKGELNDLVCDL